MLFQLDNPGPAVAALAADPAGDFVFRNFCNLVHDNGARAVVLADSLGSPSVLVSHYQGSVMVAGNQKLYRPVWDDILNLRVIQQIIWPAEHVVVEELDGAVRRGLFCNSAPLLFWQAGVDAGMTPQTDGESVARLWVLEGEPRFGHLVQHPCRLGAGEELADLLVQGIHYDREGYYVRQCLKHGPSFVCEVDGQPVCWSATHISGTLGMIYTPEQHRRQGYAKSLAAFQVDHMLRRDGIACVHIIQGNTASEELCSSMGFRVYGEPLVWRCMYWPD